MGDMTLLHEDYQSLEGESQIELLTIDGSNIGQAFYDFFESMKWHFHNHTVPFTEKEINEMLSKGETVGNGKKFGKPIIFGGIKYMPFPYELTGIQRSSDSAPSRPVLQVANIDGLISKICIDTDNLLGASVSVKSTMYKYLDAENFENGNPTANESSYREEEFFVNSVQSEDREVVSFELNDPSDMDGDYFPNRQIADRCRWCLDGDYRKAPCNYAGTKYFDEFDQPIDDPALDFCGGRVRSCKLRFGETKELPFGGQPSSNIAKFMR